jgi:glycosyltransferase involved in cell wall biosynthesis
MTEKNKKLKNANIYMYLVDASPSAFYRISQPFHYLNQNDLKIKLVASIQEDYLKEAKIFYFQRIANEALFNLCILAKEENKAFLFDLDYYPYPPPFHPANQAFKAMQPYLQLVLSNATLVTTPTQPLAKELKRFNENVEVVPNFIDDELFSALPPASREELGISSDAVVVGWVGDNTHSEDLMQVKRTLERLALSHEKIIICFFGFNPAFFNLPENKKFVLDYYRFTSYPKFLDVIDVGIIPLSENLYNRCKSPILALEFGQKKTPVIASDIEPYRQLVEEGAPIHLAKDASEWRALLEHFVSDASVRKKSGEELFQFVQKKYLLRKNYRKYLHIFQKSLDLLARGQEGSDPTMLFEL